MAPSLEPDIDKLIERLAGEGSGYRKKLERQLKRLQLVMKAPWPIRVTAGNRVRASTRDRAIRLELALLDGLRDGTLTRMALPDGSSAWSLDTDTVKRWFTEKEIA